jgi:hypothetical protein
VLTDAELDHVGGGAFNDVYTRGIVISGTIQEFLGDPYRGVYAQSVVVAIPPNPITPS